MAFAHNESIVLLFTPLIRSIMKSPNSFAYAINQSLAQSYVTYIVKVAIINQLHDEKYVEEKLSLWMLHDFKHSLVCAVECVFETDSVF